MNRRNFLSLIAAAPLVAALPVLAKSSDPLGGRRHFVNETIHMYETLVLDERMAGLHMDGCRVIFHGDFDWLVYVPPTEHFGSGIWCRNNIYMREAPFNWPQKSATWLLQ